MNFRRKLIAGIGIILLLHGIFYHYADLRINEAYYDLEKRKIHDGEFILLKRDNESALLVLNDQDYATETARYRWFLRSGGGRFNDMSTHSGSGMTGDGLAVKHKLGGHESVPIEFGSYKFYWSRRTPGEGWVYFNYFPEHNSAMGPFWYCITGEKDINAIDTNDRKYECRKISIVRVNPYSYLYHLIF